MPGVREQSLRVDECDSVSSCNPRAGSGRVVLSRVQSVDGIRILTKTIPKQQPIPPVSMQAKVESCKSISGEPNAGAVLSSEGDEVSDAASRKRMFLRMAGVAGVGLAASALLPKKAEALVFGSTPASNVVGMKDSSNARIDPAKENGNLATVKTNTDPLVTSGGGGYVRQDSTATIAKETGGNLATVKTNTDPLVTSGGGGYVRQDSTATIAKETGGNLAAIKTNTDKFTFDLSGNLLTTGSAAASVVGLKDTTNTQIDPVRDDSVVLLRRMVKLMESQAAADSANRQRITLDSLGTGTAVTTTVPVSGTVAVSTVTTVSGIDGQNRQMFQDFAKTAYATGIRQFLVFS